jgi:hypothetical protein
MSNYRSKDTLLTFAKIAADEYLGKSKTPLNSALRKIASQESLTPHQMEYVAAESNKAVWAKLFALNKEASYDFPLADAKEILKDLQVVQQKSQLDEADLDYLSPPTSTKVASFDPFVALGVVAENMEKSASAKKLVKRELQARFEKLSQAKEDLEREQIVLASQIESIELEFIKTAQNMVLEYSFEERGLGMDKLAEFLRGCDRPEYAKDLMHKLSHVMKKRGFIKQADLKAPSEYISDKLPTRIVNGRHQLYVMLKTLCDKRDQFPSLQSKYEIVDSSLPVIQEKIREL